MKGLAFILLASSALATVPIGVSFWQSTSSGPPFPYDSIDSYSDGAPLDGLNGGVHWDAAFVDKNNILGIQSVDTMDDYSDGILLGGLNLGVGWNGGYVERLPQPSASPAYGAPSQTVTLSGVSGASIYYTVDGSDPTTSSTLYSGAISITSDTTLKAIQTKTGWNDSFVHTWRYVALPTSTLVALFEADNLSLSDGASVSSWSDSSGNGHTASQASGTLEPVLKTNVFGTAPAVEFDGTNDYLSIASTVTVPSFTVFAVTCVGHRDDSTSFGPYQTPNMLWWHSGIAGFALNGDSTQTYGAHLTVYNTGGGETQNKKMNSTVWPNRSVHLLVWQYDGTTVTARADGSAKTVASNDGGFGTTPNDQIGWHYQYSQSRFGAIAVFSSVLGTNDLATMECYLTNRFPISP